MDSIAEAHNSLRRANWSATDRLMGWLLLAHLPVVLLEAAFYGHWALAVVGGAVISGSAFAATRLMPGRLATRAYVAAAFMFYSALLIDIGGGAVVFHFHVFVGLAFLMVYRDSCSSRAGSRSATPSCSSRGASPAWSKRCRFGQQSCAPWAAT
jgi:hypothetical protein